MSQVELDTTMELARAAMRRAAAVEDELRALRAGLQRLFARLGNGKTKDVMVLLDLPDIDPDPDVHAGADPAASPPSLADMERAHIERVLVSVRGNRTRAAALLGIGRSTLKRKLAAYAAGDRRSAS